MNEEQFLHDIFFGDGRGVQGLLVLRNYEGLPRSVENTDIDVLVRKDYAAKFDGRIVDLAAAHEGAVIGFSRSPTLTKACVFGWSQQGWWGLRFDALTAIDYGGAPLLDIEKLFEQALIHNAIAVLDDRIADVVALLKDCLFANELKDRYLDGARRAYIHRHRDLAAVFAPMGNNAFATLREICFTQEPGRLSPRAVSRLRRAVIGNALRNDPVGFLIGRFRFYVSRFSRFLSPPGLVIAVLGTDGVGKSSVIDTIGSVFEDATHAPVSVRHLRPGILPALGRFRGQVHTSGKPVSDPHASQPAGRIGSLIRLIWLWLDYVIGYWIVVRPQIAKSPTVFLFDRYADDVAVDPLRFRLSSSARICRLFPRLVPRPDLLICLTADPEAILSRKAELPFAEIQRQVAALEQWAQERREAIVVPTNGSIKQTKDTVLFAIRDHLRKRGCNQ